MCIFCYLDTYKQYKIRKGVQLRTDRFEHTLEKYKLSFSYKFSEHLEKDLCENHNNENNSKILYKLKQIKSEDIIEFFDLLKASYIYWIDSRPVDAVDTLKKILNKHNILKNTITMDGSILFRGRQSKEFLSHWDMFHIPFNKRYCIKNERYSLIGQPLLYLASSPYCVFKELFTTEDVKLSSFILTHNKSKNLLKEKTNTTFSNNDPYDGNNLTFFDNTNTIDNLIQKNYDSSIISNVNRLITNNDDLDINSIFFKYILANCCSFSLNNSQRGNSFSEEYVLPQLLSQIVKANNFDGIMFNSTRCYDEKILCEDQSIFNMLCKNICIFTKYNLDKIDDITYVYDKELYNKFSISTALDFAKYSVNIDYYDIDKSLTLFNKIMNLNIDTFYSNLLIQISNYLCCYKELLKNDEFKKSISENNKDLFLNSINLHSLQLRNILLNIYDEFYKKEIV